ncbi:PD-(D/E)XK nuclease family protein [Candidatus Woesearchaeota archaeon]|nr:PD-(D/E)XK nuclease family protein [Candidatus Woesearchaeota archaeon]
MALHGRRFESPSSINTYKQCPRKYYYRYIEQLPTSTSIHLIRGSVVHKVLEDFFDAELSENGDQFKLLHLRLLSLFQRYWEKHKSSLDALSLSVQELQVFFDESVLMLQNWFNRFRKRMEVRMEQGESFSDTFQQLTPRREEEFRSEEFMVRGFVDAIHEVDGRVKLMDYKTSKNGYISDEYKLQLAIYALLFEEKHGHKPHFVGIDFLKSVEQLLEVDDDLVKHAKFEVEQIHASTESDHIDDYPQRPGPLCKWRTGQCDYYDVCFNGMTLDEHREKFGRK